MSVLFNMLFVKDVENSTIIMHHIEPPLLKLTTVDTKSVP